MEAPGEVGATHLAELRGRGEILGKDWTWVICRLGQLEQRQRGQTESRGRAFLQDLPVDIQQRVQL